MHPQAKVHKHYLPHVTLSDKLFASPFLFSLPLSPPPPPYFILFKDLVMIH